MRRLSPLEKNAVLFARTAKIERLSACLERGLPPTFSGLLQAAAERGKLEVIEFLLARGADPNQPDDEGDRALHSAAATGQRPAVELLLARGADPNLKDASAATPLSCARDGGHAEIVRLLEPLTDRRTGYSVDGILSRGGDAEET